MKLAGIFIGLINVASMVVAADAAQQQAQESTIISHTLREDEVNKHGLAYAYHSPNDLKLIKKLVDNKLTFDWKKADHESGFELTISGAPKSVQEAENLLKTWANSLVSLESQVPFSKPRWEYLRRVQENDARDKNSAGKIFLMPKKLEQVICICMTTIPGQEECAKKTLNHRVNCYGEEAITVKPEDMAEIVAGIEAIRKDLVKDEIVVCIDMQNSTIHLAGARPYVDKWMPTLKSIVGKASKGKEKEERADQIPCAAAKVPTQQEGTDYVLVQNHRDVSFGDVATALGRKLSVRVGEIKKSKICPDFLEVPLPKSKYVDPAVALKNVKIVNSSGGEISLQILDPRNTAHIKYNMGLLVSEMESAENEYINNLRVSKHELISPDAVARAIARVFRVGPEHITVAEQEDGYYVHANCGLDTQLIPKDKFIRLTWDDFASDHIKIRLDAQGNVVESDSI